MKYDVFWWFYICFVLPIYGVYGLLCFFVASTVDNIFMAVLSVVVGVYSVGACAWGINNAWKNRSLFEREV